MNLIPGDGVSSILLSSNFSVLFNKGVALIGPAPALTEEIFDNYDFTTYFTLFPVSISSEESFLCKANKFFKFSAKVPYFDS